MSELRDRVKSIQQEVHSKEQELGAKIAQLVMEFEADTGLHVRRLDIDALECVDGSRMITHVDVDTEVT